MPVQTTLTAPGLEEFLDALVARVQCESGVPGALAGQARAVTARNLAHLGPLLSGRDDQRRVSAYFAGVLRRAAVRSNAPGAAEYRRRIIAASLAADLRRSGADEARVTEELAACLGAGRAGLRLAG